MSFKIKQIIKKIFYISTLSLIFILGFNFLNTNIGEINIFTKNNNINKTQAKEYKNINIQTISQVGVAITTNIGMGNNKNQKLNEQHINKELFSISDFYSNSLKIKNRLIKNNMIFLQEYFNIAKADFNKIVKKSNNKEKTVNNLIKQLRIRYKNANINLNNLKKQKTILSSEYEKISTQIETLKKNLEIHFNKNQSQEVFNDVDNYYILKEKQIILKTNIIFINNFIKKYYILNNYNSKNIEAINLNKDAIIKNSYVVIPKSGTKLLKDFDLLYSEDQYKNLKK